MKWISVQDRLPKEDGEYIVFNGKIALTDDWEDGNRIF